MGMISDIFAGDAPQRNVANYDEYANQLMDKSLADSMTPVESKFQDVDKNLDVGKQSYGLLSGVDGAIKEKYGRLLSTELGNLGAQEKQNLRMKQTETLRRAQHAVAAKQAVQNDAMASLLEAQTMREAARAQAIGSIIGIGASIGAIALAKKKPKDTTIDTTEDVVEDKPLGVFDRKAYHAPARVRMEDL